MIELQTDLNRAVLDGLIVSYDLRQDTLFVKLSKKAEENKEGMVRFIKFMERKYFGMQYDGERNGCLVFVKGNNLSDDFC